MDTFFRLETSGLELRLDRGTGRIIGLIHGATGHDAIRQPWAGGLFRLVLDDGEVVDGAVQEVERAETKPGFLRLLYRRPMVRGRAFDMDVVCTFAATDDGTGVSARIEVANREPCVIVETVAFPVLDGLGEHLGNEPAALLTPFLGGELRPRPVTGGESAFAYPYPNKAMSWMDLFSAREGLYLGSHDPEFRWTTLRGEVADVRGSRRLALWFEKHPWIRPGEEFASSPIVLRFHDGDWHAGARIYRAWADTWLRLPDVPRRVRESRGLMEASVKDSDGTTWVPYEDLPRLARDAKEELGLEILHLCGWHYDGFDTYYPHYPPLDEMGGAEALRAAVSEVRSLGVLVDLYVNIRIANTLTTFYRRTANRWAIRRRDGSEVIERYNRMPFAPLCPVPEPRRQHFYDLITRIAADYGADGIQADQPHTRAWPCHDERHGHPTPYDHWGPAFSEFFRDLVAAARHVNPEFFTWGEAHSDVFGQFFDVQQYYARAEGERLAFGNLVDGEWVSDPNQGIGLPEVFRYAFPEFVLFNSLRIVRGENPEEAAHRNRVWALGVGVYFGGMGCGYRIERIDPEYRRAFKAMYDARHEAREAMIYGRFLDQDGLTVDSEHVRGKAFVGRETAAVTLVNQDRARAHRVRVGADFETWGMPEARRLRWSELLRCGESGEPATCRGVDEGVVVTLPPNSAALVHLVDR